MCSFHAQPILTARLRSASRCRANHRKGRAFLAASLFASAAASRRRSVTVGSQTRGNTAPCLATGDHLRDGSRKFSRFTHWCRSYARGWSPVCWGPDAASAASVSRGKRGAVVAPCSGWRSAAAGSPGLRASSRAGTRRAGITGASANSYPPGPGSARGSAPAPRRRLISLLEQFQMSRD